MADLSVNSVGGVRGPDGSGMSARSPVQPAQADAAQTTSAAQAARPAAQSQAPEKAPAQNVSSMKTPENSSAALVGNLSNVSLQFKVDEKTKDVTVFVVDRSSKKVLRSIPASELAKLQAGDLVKLTA